MVRLGVPWAPSFSKPRLRMFTALGVAVGGGAMLWFLAHNPDGRGVATSAWLTLAALILTAPWSGQAFADLVVDHRGKLLP